MIPLRGSSSWCSNTITKNALFNWSLPADTSISYSVSTPALSPQISSSSTSFPRFPLVFASTTSVPEKPILFAPSSVIPSYPNTVTAGISTSVNVFNSDNVHFRPMELIREVYKRPILWDKTDPNQRCSQAKNVAWDEIAAKLELPVNEVRKKWRSTRDTYVRRKRDDLDKIYWPYFKIMRFIDKVPIDDSEFDNDPAANNTVTITIPRTVPLLESTGQGNHEAAGQLPQINNIHHQRLAGNNGSPISILPRTVSLLESTGQSDHEAAGQLLQMNSILHQRLAGNNGSAISILPRTVSSAEGTGQVVSEAAGQLPQMNSILHQRLTGNNGSAISILPRTVSSAEGTGQAVSEAAGQLPQMNSILHQRLSGNNVSAISILPRTVFSAEGTGQVDPQAAGQLPQMNSILHQRLSRNNGSVISILPISPAPIQNQSALMNSSETFTQETSQTGADHDYCEDSKLPSGKRRRSLSNYSSETDGSSFYDHCQIVGNVVASYLRLMSEQHRGTAEGEILSTCLKFAYEMRNEDVSTASPTHKKRRCSSSQSESSEVNLLSEQSESSQVNLPPEQSESCHVNLPSKRRESFEVNLPSEQNESSQSNLPLEQSKYCQLILPSEPGEATVNNIAQDAELRVESEDKEM